MTTVWPSRRLRFGRSRRTRRGSDDGMEKGPPTVRRWGRVPPPRAGFRVPWFPSGVPRAAEHGNGRHHAKGRRTIRHKEIFKESDGPVRKGKGWPAGSDLIGSGLPPRSGFHGAREGVPAACPRRESNPAPSQRRKQRRYRWGLGRVREGKDLGAPVGPCGGSWGTVRRTGPGSGSSDHSSEPSVSAGAFALRRRETAMRAAPPPSTTTAASAISAMPAPVWARVLR